MARAIPMKQGIGLWKVAAVGVVAAILVGAGFAYTASNTVPTSKSGEGSNTISGYSVASVHYTLNTTDPTKVDAVAFTLDTAPSAGSTIRVRLDSSGTTWYSCTNTGVNVTCTTTSPQAKVVDASQLSVIVAQ